MELLFVVVIAAGIGLIVRWLMPGNGSYGLLLLPAIAAAAAAITWVGLLWAARLTFDGTWIWVAAIAAAVIAPIVAAVLVPRRRAAADAELFERVASGKA